MNDTICYLNGEYAPVSQAKVSVLDRGFIFGDGIYEVVPVYARRLFRFDEHMARLDRSLSKVRIANPHSRDEWLERCRALVAGLPVAEDQLVYIQVTRGVAPRDHVMPEGLTPTVFMMANPMKPATAEQRHQGVACVTARDFRWERGDIKSTACWATCWRGRCRPTTARWRPSCSATAGSPRPRPATSGSPTRARCSARRRASMCSKASASNC
jgi:D-alanine transaminase